MSLLFIIIDECFGFFFLVHVFFKIYWKKNTGPAKYTEHPKECSSDH